MGVWDNIKGGFVSGMMGKGPNYVRKQQKAWAEFQGLMAQVALKAYSDYAARRESDTRYKIDEITGRERKVGRNEWRDGDNKVSVIDGYSRDYDRYVTDILIFPRNVQGRQHVVIDGDGNVLLNEWHDK